MDNELLINSHGVVELFLKCLYTAEEVQNLNEGEIPEGAILVEGIQGKFGFHPDRLEAFRGQVTKWLEALPHLFREDVGGGWSFLNACNQENGVQWTGMHSTVDQLFCLGIGLGLVQCQVPRELAAMLPGGMPYYVIKI